jgi:hypothetical protein
MSRAGAGRVERDTPRTSRTIAVLCLVAGAVAWSQLGPAYVRVLRPPTDPGPDYLQDWASAKSYWAGLPVYSPHSTTIPLHLGRPQSEREIDIEYNAHPPASVLLALPLARLDFPDAILAWNLISMAALLVSLAIIAAGFPELKALFLPVGILLPFGLPVYGNFQQVQLTPVLLAMIAAAWAMDQSGRPAAAGLFVGAAAAVKLFPAYLVLYFAARRSWRALLAAAASFAALNLATAAVLGWQAVDDYVRIVLPGLEKFRSYSFNQSIAGFWHKLFDLASEPTLAPCLWHSPTLARVGAVLSGLLVTAIVVAAAFRAHAPAQRDAAFAIAVTAMLLVSPITWDVSMLLLLLPLAVLASTAQASPATAAPLALILLVLWLPQQQLGDLITAAGSIPPTSPAFLLGPMSAKFYALLATFVLAAADPRVWACPPRPPTISGNG